MKVEEAIKKALRGSFSVDFASEGQFYILSGTETGQIKTMACGWDAPIERIFLDPTFWRALGKAQLWTETLVEMPRWEHVGIGMVGYTKKPEPVPTWLFHWHRFIDHIAGGKTAEEFFEGL